MQLSIRFPKATMSIFFITIIIVFMALTQQVSAHATLEKATPNANSVVNEQPGEIELQFNEPVHAQYSSMQIFDDTGSEIAEVKPSTTGSSQTLSFPVDELEKGTHNVKWQTMSADGHEISDTFEFSIGKETANGIDTTPPFYEKADFWFGALRFITEGLIITLSGLFLVNQLASRKGLLTFQSNQYIKPIVWMLMMLSVMTALVYMMTLSSDVVSDVLSLQTAALIQVPFVLTMVAIIVLLGLFTLKHMSQSWYVFITMLMLITLSMSGHAWSQSVPIWSILIRTVHIGGMSLWLGALIYLLLVIRAKSNQSSHAIRAFLLKLNTIAVALIIISGVLMSIDQTNILAIWTNIQTWRALLIVKVVLTLIMMTLGFYQTTRALGKQHRANKVTLYIELIMGIILILVGVIMSQINIPG
ncbi:MAG: copper resistance CopC/CopD family protein [Staphylococcus equorum]|nr:copper resistance protein CopC [Staphylococcus equorum]